MAAPLEARDRLLPDEAALRERDGGRDEPDLRGHPALVHVVAEANLARVDTQGLKRGSIDAQGTSSFGRRDGGIRGVGGDDDVATRKVAKGRVEDDTVHGHVERSRTDQRHQPPTVGLLDRHLRTEAVPRQRHHERLDADGIEVEQKALFGEPRHPRIGDHLRLRGQKQRPARLANGHAGDVLRHEVLQKPLRHRPLHHHKAAVGLAHHRTLASGGDRICGGERHAIDLSLDSRRRLRCTQGRGSTLR